MNKRISTKKALFTFTIWQCLVAAVIYMGFSYTDSGYYFIAVFFMELYAFSKLEDALIELPESLKKYNYNYEHGIEADASVINIESTGAMTEFGEYYVFKLSLQMPPRQLEIETEVRFSIQNIQEYSTIPIRYLPDTMEAIILFDKLDARRL